MNIAGLSHPSLKEEGGETIAQKIFFGKDI
jgi:hypothetical protein